MSILYGGRKSNNDTWARTKERTEQEKPFDLVEGGRETWLDIHDAACNVEKWGDQEDDEAFTCHKFIQKMKQIADTYKCYKCRSRFMDVDGLNEQIVELEDVLSSEVDEARDVCVLWASRLHASVTQRLLKEEGSAVSYVSKKWVRVWADLKHQGILLLTKKILLLLRSKNTNYGCVILQRFKITRASPHTAREARRCDSPGPCTPPRAASCWRLQTGRRRSPPLPSHSFRDTNCPPAQKMS